MRNTPPKITLVAILVLILAFTLSCTDDGGSGGNGGGGDILGSCIGTSFPELGLSDFCAENLAQEDCSEANGTFSIGGTCDKTSYPYCLEIKESSINCLASGSAACLIDGEGYLLVTSATCGGPVGSCVTANTLSEDFRSCLDMPENLCLNSYKPVNDGPFVQTNFNSGECSVSEYPCCVSENSEIINWFSNSFSKNDCLAEGGVFSSSAICASLNPPD